MRKTYVLKLAAAVLLTVESLMAQHQHGGAPAGGAGGASGGGLASINPGNSPLQRAFDLQATEAQAQQIRLWIRSTATLRTKLEQFSETARDEDSKSVLQQFEELRDTLERRKVAAARFVAELSASQRSELKKEIKRLSEANRALGEASSGLNLTPAVVPDGKQIMKEIQKALKAVTIEQKEQQKLADEMGVNIKR